MTYSNGIGMLSLNTKYIDKKNLLTLYSLYFKLCEEGVYTQILSLLYASHSDIIHKHKYIYGFINSGLLQVFFFLVGSTKI